MNLRMRNARLYGAYFLGFWQRTPNGVSADIAVWAAFWVFQAAALFLLASSQPLAAATENVCDSAARQASVETGVPLPVLWAITRTETGRNRNGRLEPWPWTVNMEGEGRWFASRDAARAYASANYRRGARSFDIGCFQINHRWHGASFASINHMFDPLENARYAAAFLLRLYQETGNWTEAAGHYHSRTPEFARKYKARFERIKLAHDPGQDPRPSNSVGPGSNTPSPGLTRENTYPLLTDFGTSRGFGSLVPLASGSARALVVISGRSEGL